MPWVTTVLPWDDLTGASATPSVTSASCQPEVVGPIRSASFVGYLFASAACDELTTLGHGPRLRPAELPPRRDRSPPGGQYVKRPLALLIAALIGIGVLSTTVLEQSPARAAESSATLVPTFSSVGIYWSPAGGGS